MQWIDQERAYGTSEVTAERFGWLGWAFMFALTVIAFILVLTF